MKKAIVVVGLLAVVAIVVGANVDGTAKPISQIPITQAFHLDLGRIGAVNKPMGPKPYIATMPAYAGIAITQAQNSYESSTSKPLTIRVNGQIVCRTALGYSSNYNTSPISFNPPILVSPGATVEVGLWNLGSQSFYADVVLSGYYLTLADLGK